MHQPINIETKSEALRLRGILTRLSDISYSFSKLNKEYPLDYQDQKATETLIRTYHGLIRDLLPTLQTYQEEFSGEGESSAVPNQVNRPTTSGVATNA